MTIQLESPRLTFRRLNKTDIPFILDITHDPDWLRFIGDRHIVNSNKAQNYIANTRENFTTLGYGLWVVEIKSPTLACDPKIGLCGLVKRDFLAYPDLGFAFLPHGRGKGYALEAATAVLKWAATYQGKQPISAIVHKQNLASIRLLNNAGFKPIARMVSASSAEHILMIHAPS
jgi:RimJ/RimL family protein N-acetyltransferase